MPRTAMLPAPTTPRRTTSAILTPSTSDRSAAVRIARGDGRASYTAPAGSAAGGPGSEGRALRGAAGRARLAVGRLVDRLPAVQPAGDVVGLGHRPAGGGV